MTTNRNPESLVSLIQELCKLPGETEWLEFKVNNDEPQEIGEYISALANSSALCGKAFAYLVWGIDNETHAVVGTRFSPSTSKIGNEELENWLLRLLAPKIHFHFFEFLVEGQHIRIGSYKKKLKEFPEKERALWRIFDQTPFEDGIAVERVTSDDVLRLLDYPAYFDLMKRPLPEGREGILQSLVDDELILPADAGGWNITNLGAILFAKRLNDFRSLRRKATRVIVYRGNSRVETIKEQVGGKGYACGFEGLIDFINGLLPPQIAKRSSGFFDETNRHL